jgi:predicted O-linked N-acetylglucosamine transferase (SPINDLY family)
VLDRAARLAGAAGGPAGSNLLLALNYAPFIGDDQLAEAHRRWGAAAVAAVRPPTVRSLAVRSLAATPPDRPRSGGRLRLGYVSPDFKRHPVGYFLAGVLENHDRARIEAIGYSDTAAPDDLTARLRAAAAGWRETRSLSDEALAGLVAADGIDILVDLAGHTAGNRLGVFARKPAPCQVSWLGYFHTTGLPTIDAVLTDADSVPQECRHWFSERVVPLPEGRFCYAPPADAPPVAPSPLATGGRPMFGSFNNLAKLTPAVIGLWAALLRRLPEASLTLKWHTLADPGERQALSAAFAARGVAAGRLVLSGPSRHAAMLDEYAGIDVALDPFPFNGCLTTLEALWMGVPVVTLAGRRPVARQSLAILRRIGQDDLVAASPDEVLDIASRLVADPAALAARRAALRGRVAGRLCDAPAFTRALEAALEALLAP